MNSATIAFRVKPEIKRRADELFSRLGMTTSTAMNILLMQTLEHRGFAAPASLEKKTPKDQTRPRCGPSKTSTTTGTFPDTPPLTPC